MSKLGYKITSLIICDDIRREASGKEILIGVYSKDIIVKDIPTRLPQLSFRISVALEHANFKKMRFSLSSPSRQTLVYQESDIRVRRVDLPLIVGLTFSLPAFEEAGLYSVKFGLDSPARKVGEFSVRLPESEAERARLVG